MNVTRWCLGVLLLASSTALACQPCTIIDIGSAKKITFHTLYGNPASGLEIRVRKVIPLPNGQAPKQQLSCLTQLEIGDVIQKGKSDRTGRFSINNLPPGKYWIAARDKALQAVYVIVVGNEKVENEPGFLATESGLVQNKCDIEPIGLFFR